VNGKGDVDGGASLRVIDAASANKDGQACKSNEKSVNLAAGPVAAPVWGDAEIWVTRNANSATPDVAKWADFSTILGSPSSFGSDASGVVRFSCSTAPCRISVKAWVSSGTGHVYPRLVIYRQELFSSTVVNECEYVDGVDNNGGSGQVGTSPSDLMLGAGGTLDCLPGSPQSGGPVQYIEVPQGRYDIHSTFYFTP
jgi:hypothetical protein